MMDPVMKWGIGLILILQSIPGLTLLMQFFTFLGNEPFYLFILPAIYWCLDPRLGRRLALILVLSNSLNGLLKIAFHLPRPAWIDPRIKVLSLEKSYGLPSGHAMNAVALWGYLADLAPTPDPAVWSQNAALSGFTPGPGPAIQPRNPEYGLTMAGIILGLGTAFSFTGNRLKDFLTDVSWIKKGGRLLIGLGGLVALAFGMKVITPTTPSELALIMRLFRYTLLLFWTFYLAPRLFLKTNV